MNKKIGYFSRRDFLKSIGILSGGLALRPYLAHNLSALAQDVPSVEPITILINSSPWFDGFAAMVDMYTETTGNEVNLDVTPFEGMLEKARNAWKALFSPDERIAIKTNSIRGGATHPALVMALAECLQDAGVPAEQIVVFDRNTSELESEGYPVNVDGPGVRCYGNGENWGDLDNYTAGWTLLDQEIKLSNILLNCDALINIPILKHGGPGISFAMKNHYGTFDIPSYFHGSHFERGIPELNALPPIKDRTRLIVGDLLAEYTYHGLVDRYEVMAIGSTILMSFDPVAFDAVGLQIVVEKLTADGRDTQAYLATKSADPWLAVGAEIGLGTNDLTNIDLVEVNLA